MTRMREYKQYLKDNNIKLRLPTKKEVETFMGVVMSLSEKHRPKTEKGLYRITATHFHCTSKDLRTILTNK